MRNVERLYDPPSQVAVGRGADSDLESSTSTHLRNEE